VAALSVTNFTVSLRPAQGVLAWRAGAPGDSIVSAVTLRACDGLGGCTDSARAAAEPYGVVGPDVRVVHVGLACSAPCGGGTRGPSDAPAPAEVAWGQRRLLFFAGHVPKLYIAPTRYQIWQQVRRHPGVTAFSALGAGFISISGGVIDGGGTTGRSGLSFENCSRVVVEEVTLRNFGAKATRVTDSDVIAFSGCTTPCIVAGTTIDLVVVIEPLP
jgi:hypothetical protein